MRQETSESATSTKSKQFSYGTSPFRWLKPALLSLLLVVLDEQGVIAGLVGLLLLTVYLPRSFMQRFQPCRRERLIRFGIYMAAVLVVFGLRMFNTSLAQQRAHAIIRAVDAYKLKTGGYPDRLEQLVPAYLPKVPHKAKLTMMDAGFRYSSRDGSHSLSYVSLPPFGRRIYTFETASWDRLD